MSAPETVVWLALGVAALCAGFAKTAIGGIGLIGVVLAALVMPAAESTAAILLLFLPVPSAVGTCGMAPFRGRHGCGPGHDDRPLPIWEST